MDPTHVSRANRQVSEISAELSAFADRIIKKLHSESRTFRIITCPFCCEVPQFWGSIILISIRPFLRSKQLQRSHLTSYLKSGTLITSTDMPFWALNATNATVSKALYDCLWSIELRTRTSSQLKTCFLFHCRNKGSTSSSVAEVTYVVLLLTRKNLTL